MLTLLCNCTALLFSTTCLSASSYMLPVITSLLCSLLGINKIEIYILSIYYNQATLQLYYWFPIPMSSRSKVSYLPKTHTWVPGHK